ncbi:MAG: T9SS type A sorting domain-containing protein [Bacteroidia bacterium]
MKKTISLLVLAFGIAANVYAKGHHVLIAVNHTTGDSISQNVTSFGLNINVPAVAGDSLTLYVYYEDIFGNFTLENPQQWFLDGDSIVPSHLADPLEVIAPDSGVFSAVFNGSLFMQFTIVTPTGLVEHHESDNSLKIFPNVTGTSLSIQLSVLKQCDVIISFYDADGNLFKKSLDKAVAGEFVKNVNIEALPAGYYTVRVTTPGKLLSAKFIKL